MEMLEENESFEKSISAKQMEESQSEKENTNEKDQEVGNREFVQFNQDKDDSQADIQSEAVDPFGGDSLSINIDSNEPMEVDSAKKDEKSRSNKVQDQSTDSEKKHRNEDKGQTADKSDSETSREDNSMEKQVKETPAEKEVTTASTANSDKSTNPSEKKDKESTQVLPGQDNELCIIPNSTKENKAERKNVEHEEQNRTKIDDNKILQKFVNPDEQLTAIQKESDEIQEDSKKSFEKLFSNESSRNLNIKMEESQIKKENTNEKDEEATTMESINYQENEAIITEKIDELNKSNESTENKESSGDSSKVASNEIAEQSKRSPICSQCQMNKLCDLKVKVGINTFTVCSNECRLDIIDDNRGAYFDKNTPKEVRCIHCAGKIDQFVTSTSQFCSEKCLKGFTSDGDNFCSHCQVKIFNQTGLYPVAFGCENLIFCTQFCLNEWTRDLLTCGSCQRKINKSVEIIKEEQNTFCSKACQKSFHKFIQNTFCCEQKIKDFIKSYEYRLCTLRTTHYFLLPDKSRPPPHYKDCIIKCVNEGKSRSPNSTKCNCTFMIKLRQGKKEHKQDEKLLYVQNDSCFRHLTTCKKPISKDKDKDEDKATKVFLKCNGCMKLNPETTTSSDTKKNQRNLDKKELDKKKFLKVKDLEAPKINFAVLDPVDENQNSTRSLIEEINHLSSKLDKKNEQILQLQKLLSDNIKTNDELTSQILEMKGKVRVLCRIRSSIPEDKKKRMCDFKLVDDKTMQIESQGNKKKVKFDKIFTQLSSQSDLFSNFQRIIKKAFAGHSVCVMAYGPTGGGKTYSMCGLPETEKEGIVPLSVRQMFDEIQFLELVGWDWTVKAQFIELFHEEIYDLSADEKTQHTLRRDAKDTFFTTVDPTKFESANEFLEHFEKCMAKRTTKNTTFNHCSSRSHMFIFIDLIGKRSNQSITETTRGRIAFVDLAGCEKLEDNPDRRKEGTAINLSLLELSKIILSLQQSNPKKITYSACNLTRILKPYLSNMTNTIILICINLLNEAYSSTINAISFGERVKTLKFCQSLKKDHKFE